MVPRIQSLIFRLVYHAQEGIIATNSCAMDSVLMCLYLLQKDKIVPLHHFMERCPLSQVLNHISEGKYFQSYHKCTTAPRLILLVNHAILL